MRRLLLLLLPAVAVAQPEDPSAREAEIFGAPAPASEAPAAPAGDREAEMFGAPVSQAPETQAEKPASPALPPPDPLTIGGRLWLRLDFSVFEDTDAADQPVSMPNLLDVYLDATPVERVRAFASARFAYDPTADSFDLTGRNTASLDELWLRMDIERVVFFTLGAQHIRWGTGRVWNPTDVLNREARDPLAPADLRTGAPLLRAELPIAAVGGALQVVGRLDKADTLGQVGGAARLQAVAGPAEVSLMASARDEEPLVLGLDFSAGVGPFDLYAEAAISHGEASRWTGDFDPAAALSPRLTDRDEDWIPQVVAGLEWPIAYGDDDTLVVGAEYFFNDFGYSDAELYPWLLFRGGFTPFYLGRHYAAAYLVLVAPGTWDDTSFALTALANLSDRSAAARLNISHLVMRRLAIEPYVAASLGPAGGEFRFRLNEEIPEGYELIEGLPASEATRLSTPAPLLQAGLWFRVPF